MLAYNEKGTLCEFVETENIAVCTNCRKLYSRYISEQIPGFREREDDACPYCGHIMQSSMHYEFSNTMLTSAELASLRRRSLYDMTIDYCNNKYISTECRNCNHHNGCPNSSCNNCKQCLVEVHFPKDYPTGRKDYECEHMLDFYVCSYAPKYASEMLYLMKKSEALKDINNYHVISIGCGAAPDLMALEKYCHDTSPNKTISYIGIDVNERWKAIHNQINTYRTSTIQKTQFMYCDAVDDDISIEAANVIVLQYVISHLYNSGQIHKRDVFFEKLVTTIIKHKQENIPCVILINDVNSSNRGRNFFLDLVEKLKGAGFHGHSYAYYFDYNIVHPEQRYGNQQPSNSVLFDVPTTLEIYQPWRNCSSAQLLIEVN